MEEKHDAENGNSQIIKWAGIGAGVLILILLAVPALQMKKNNRSEMVAEGLKLYQSNCQACHGTAGIGQDPTHPQGGLQPDHSYIAPALNAQGAAWYKTDAELLDYIKKGSNDPNSPMRKVADKLSDRELASLLVYIQSLWPTKIITQHEENSNPIPGATTEHSY